MTHSFGWIKDKWNDKAVYHLPKVITYPISADMLSLCPPVRNQDGVGACTGFGIGGEVGTVAKAGGFFTEWFSPNWLYNGGRAIEGTLTQDAGAAPQDVFDWATAHGLLLEHFWPFIDKLDKAAPSSLRESEAVMYPDWQLVRVDNGLDGILSALSEGHCVALGSPWSQRWENDVKADGILDDPNGSMVAGGHETFLHGYDTTVSLFDGQNSWGTSFGKQGHYRMPFTSLQWFKDNGGYDAHYVVFLNSPNPIPNPPASCGCPGTKLFRKLVKLY